MNIAYTAIVGFSNNATTAGVENKVIAQACALKLYVKRCHLILVYISDSNDNTKVQQTKYGQLDITKVYVIEKNILKRRLEIFKKLYEILHNNSYDYIYIRYPLSDPWFYNFIKKIKNDNFTFLITEHQSIEHNELLADISVNKIFKYLFERIYRNRALKNVDYHVAVTDEIKKKLDPEKSITITNGIDTSLYFTKTKTKTNIGDKISLVYIGNIQSWSGLDVLIKALSYHNFCIDKKDIELHIIGDGVFRKHLEKSVIESHQKKSIVFHGYLTGQKKIDTLLSCHAGVGSLSSGRRSIKEGSNLKLREYCVLGIPFFKSDYDADFDGFEHINPYIYNIQLETTLQEQLVDIIHFVQKSNKLDRSVMINHAINNLDWKAKMLQLVNHIRK